MSKAETLDEVLGGALGPDGAPLTSQIVLTGLKHKVNVAVMLIEQQLKFQADFQR